MLKSAYHIILYFYIYLMFITYSRSKRYDQIYMELENPQNFNGQNNSTELRLEDQTREHKTTNINEVNSDIIAGELSLEENSKSNNMIGKQLKLSINKNAIKQRNVQKSSSKSLHSELLSSKRRMRKKMDSNQIEEYIRNQRLLMLFSKFN